MGCGDKSVRRLDVSSRCPRVDRSSLGETGRLHFFYHSPDSPLPVRDVLNGHGQGPKKEPHLEKRAENYCVPCLQKNIHGFLDSKEKYLFLFTRRSGPAADRERYIVGYLTKEKCLQRSYRNKPHLAVQGRIILVSFADAFRLKNLRGLSASAAIHLRFRKLNRDQTQDLLSHFKKRTDIFAKCLREVLRLKKELTKREANASCSNTCRN